VLFRSAWRRASLILVQNRETRAWLPKSHRGGTEIFPNVVLGDDISRPSEGVRPARTAVYAGNLLPLKGVALAVRALLKAPGWKLVVFGKGWDEGRLRRLVRRHHLEDRVTFAGQVPRARLLEFLSHEASVLVFPSLHDEAGWVVAEARACGIPVVCLDRGGPPLLGGTAVPIASAARTAAAIAAALQQVDQREPPAPPRFDSATRGRALHDILSGRGLIDEGPTSRADRDAQANDVLAERVV